MDVVVIIGIVLYAIIVLYVMSPVKWMSWSLATGRVCDIKTVSYNIDQMWLTTCLSMFSLGFII